MNFVEDVYSLWCNESKAKLLRTFILFGVMKAKGSLLKPGFSLVL